jgi:hypothetical protein
MHSNFCVLLALVKLASFVVYLSAPVIKKRRYWSTYIEAHFDFKEIEQRGILPSTLEGTEFKVFCMKEEDYGIKLKDMYGALAAINR